MIPWSENFTIHIPVNICFFRECFRTDSFKCTTGRLEARSDQSDGPRAAELVGQLFAVTATACSSISVDME